MASDNSNSKDKKWILFCPYCHSVRTIGHEPSYNETCRCHRCESVMFSFMPKAEFDVKSKEEKENLVKSLKRNYPDTALPTEILLGKIYDSLWTIKSILQFYFALTILGIIIAFFGYAVR